MKDKKKKKRIDKISIFMAFVFITVLLIRQMFVSDRYRYINTTLFPLWYVALGIGVVLGILCFVLLKKIGLDIKTCIGTFLIVCFLSFIILGVSFGHLNHALDDNEPIKYEVTIENKHRNSGGRRGITRYKFQVTVEGDTFEIQVPSDHYYDLNKGDVYIIEYHVGAFNEPYYIGVGGINDTTQ